MTRKCSRHNVLFIKLPRISREDASGADFIIPDVAVIRKFGFLLDN